MDEDNNWALDAKELQRAYDAAKNECEPRAICIINPGNPTGQVLSRENIEEIIKFAYNNRLFILADEVFYLLKLIFQFFCYVLLKFSRFINITSMSMDCNSILLKKLQLKWALHTKIWRLFHFFQYQKDTWESNDD